MLCYNYICYANIFFVALICYNCICYPNFTLKLDLLCYFNIIFIAMLCYFNIIFIDMLCYNYIFHAKFTFEISIANIILHSVW